MAESHTHEGVEVWSIAAPDGSARAEIVPELGAVVASLTLPAAGGPRDVLFRHAHFWDPASSATRGGIPTLFPACGRVRAGERMGYWQHEGREYPLPLHGFAMRRPWVVLDHRRPHELVLGQIDGEDTRTAYPFHFELILRLAAEPGGLQCELAVTNRGEVPMPFSAGFHPYLATPAPGAGRDRVQVHLASRRRRRYDATYTGFTGGSLPPADEFSIGDPLFSEVLHDVADPLCARVMGLAGPDIEITAGGEPAAFFPHVQCHAAQQEPFVCVEPWSAPPNALNTGEGLCRLAPGGVVRCWMRIAGVEAPRSGSTHGTAMRW